MGSGGRVWSFRDVTPRRKAQEQAQQTMRDLAAQAEQLKELAFQDPLTLLANRAVFNDMRPRSPAVPTVQTATRSAHRFLPARPPIPAPQSHRYHAHR